MTDQAAITRKDLEKIRPISYLEGYGLLDEEGKQREDLGGVLASAACVQFEDAQVAPQELLTVYEAIRQSLPLNPAPKAFDRFHDAVEQAFDVTVGLLRKDVNRAIADWIYEWQPFMEDDASIAGFLSHLRSVVTTYALVAGKKARGR